MAQPIYSFSVKQKDKDAHEVVKAAKKLSDETGISFSFMVTSGLKLYLKGAQHESK